MTLYSIGQVSEMIDMPIRTIRYYERINLIAPIKTDPETNYRYYSMEEIFQLDLIRCLGKTLGMPLKTIREYIQKRNDPAMLKQYLKQQAKEIEAEINLLLMRKDFLQRKLQAVALRELTETFLPDINMLPGRRICVKPAKPANTEEALLTVRKCALETDNHYLHALYLLRDIDLTTLRMDAHSEALVGLDCDLGPAYTELYLPGGKYAQMTYQNRDNGRVRALEQFFKYVRLSGLQPAGKLIFRSTLLDATSVSSDDYYFTLELRLE